MVPGLRLCRAATTLIALLLLVSACGGGGSGSSNATAPTDPGPGGTPPTSPPAPPPPPAPDPNEAAPTATAYTLFETGQVRPLAWSADGSRLFVANTPANQLDIYRVESDQLQAEGSVPVGLEPVAVAVRDNSEVWVVNHLSDSVSIVDVGAQPHVKQTLLVGDEPRDIVFAGSGRKLAFITAAYRGQNHPTFNPDDLTTPGRGRADIWVYDSTALAKGTLNGGPLTILNLFTDSLRSLAALPDGSRVYAAAFFSGNNTTTVDASVVKGKKPGPNINVDGVPAPDTGLIVQRQNGQWLDEAGTDWSAQVHFELPDYDVFEIDTSGTLPVVSRRVSGVGTTLFNMAVNPGRGELYVSNLEALNSVRFEGPGNSASTVRGHTTQTRISVLTNNSLLPVDLNTHVNFDRPEGAAVPAAEAGKSLSQVTALQLSSDGQTLYAAALGSNKLAFIDVAALAAGSYSADTNRQLLLPGGGPSGLALSPDGSRLAVYTRFNNGIALVDPQKRAITAQTALDNPEPDYVVAGRPFLYDASLTSANGTSACASCHIFGDTDTLAWDLGNPDVSVQNNPNAFVANSPVSTRFHPMKGPMTTQTMRGIADSGPQHWRGDRTGENRAMVNGVPEPLAAAAFKEFNTAFVGLVGREQELSTAQMQQFTDFAMAITPPPNPIRHLDNSLTAQQQAGRDIYFNVDNITGIGSCNHCHSLDPQKKQFGTAGKMSFEGGRIAEDFKVPQLRNAYSKVGMFGSSSPDSDGADTGPQVRGFGYLHDGAIDTLQHFFSDPVFNFPAPVTDKRADVIRFVMVMDSNLAPVVGQQVTLSGSAPALLQRLDLLEQRAALTTPGPECELSVSGVIDGQAVNLVMDAAGNYSDSQGNAHSTGELREAAMLTGQELTFTCHPPGSTAG